jgi:hypothetical protein
VTDTMIVMLSLPFALVGGLWLMWCQSLRRGRSWLHRTSRRRRRDRYHDAHLPQSGARGGKGPAGH